MKPKLSWFASSILATGIFVMGSLELHANQDLCDKAAELAIHEIQENTSTIADALQVIETKEAVVDVLPKLFKLKDDALKNVKASTRDCKNNISSPEHIKSIGELFTVENGLAAILKQKRYEIRRGGPWLASNKKSPLAIIRSLGRKIAALPEADIVLVGPKAMKVGDKRQVDANVGINVPIEILQRRVGDADQQIRDRAHVSSQMIATLNGPGFGIEAKTPEQQGIAEGFPTVWSWNVEAKETGEQELVATLYAVLQDGEGVSRQYVRSFTHKITVAVRDKTWGEWLDSLSHGIDSVKALVLAIGTIATGVLSWLGLSRSRNKRRKNGGSGN